jgi:acetyltransferase-like isoleucine patch superfamily enzyme
MKLWKQFQFSLMQLKELIKSNPGLKRLAGILLSPSGQARPRFWVKFLLFPFYIHKGKGATIRRSSRMDVFPYHRIIIGARSTIEDFCTINNGVGDLIIAEETRIGIGSVLIGPVRIGKNVRLAQHVVVSGLNHNYEDTALPVSLQGVTTSEVVIEEGSWIGANAVILPGVKIGRNSVVAAGSVVTKNVKDFTVVAGNPAKEIRQFNDSTKKWERINKPIATKTP